MGGRVGAGLNHRECRALPEALGTRMVAAGGVLQLEGSSRRARATVGGRESRRRGLVRRRRRDLGPSRAQADGFAQTVEELRFTVIVTPPAPAPTQLEEMRAPALRESAPLLRDLLECMGRQPCRHGESVDARSTRPEWSHRRWHAEATTGQTMGCARTAHPNHERMIIRFEPGREGKPARSTSAWGKSLAGAAMGVAQKLTRPDGEIRGRGQWRTTADAACSMTTGISSKYRLPLSGLVRYKACLKCRSNCRATHARAVDG